MRVLVIGGSGLFGKKSVLALLRDPEVEGVVTMDVAPPMGYFTTLAAPHGDRFKYVKGDISDLEQVLAVADDNKVDAIINWAMILSKDPYPRANTKIGVLGMCNVFEAARLLGIKRVVFASSETVYGEQSDYGDREIVEDDRLMPYQGSFYALAKTLSEVMAAEYDQLYGIRSTALRPTIGYGHGGTNPKFVRWFSEIVSLPAVGRPIALECKGDWLFSTILSDEVGEFARLAVKTPFSPHPAYNLGGPPVSLRDFAAAVEKYIPDAQITFGDEPENCELPWKVSGVRAREDYGFTVMEVEDAVFKLINEARAEEGMPPIER
ncbi:MAG: NAD(P)-dependent oxidoreductase [Actinobacteria bacterium]|jgi:UDP-glucose 4-epimerase|nr:NAD(P)-dependent oxidoreductase [Actinomycetota bacterium]